MTIVVYRDGIMASDSLVTDNGHTYDYADKLETNKAGWIGGASGAIHDVYAFLEWVRKGCKKEFTGAQNKEFGALLVSPEGSVYFIDDTSRRARIMHGHAVVGSGWLVAMGALEMGATAEQAVAVAIKLNTSCGGDIQTIKRKA